MLVFLLFFTVICIFPTMLLYFSLSSFTLFLPFSWKRHKMTHKDWDFKETIKTKPFEANVNILNMPALEFPRWSTVLSKLCRQPTSYHLNAGPFTFQKIKYAYQDINYAQVSCSGHAQIFIQFFGLVHGVCPDQVFLLGTCADLYTVLNWSCIVCPDQVFLLGTCADLYTILWSCTWCMPWPSVSARDMRRSLYNPLVLYMVCALTKCFCSGHA